MRRRDVYGRFAEYYDAFYEERLDHAGDVKFLLAAFKKFGKGKPKRLLDIGAGTGSHALVLAKAGVKVAAVDISQPLLDVARGKVERAGVEEKVSLHRMDMTRELPTGRFDGAVSMFGAWCYARTDEESARLLSMLAQRLPKGGLFVFEFWSPLGWAPRQEWDEVDLPGGRRLVRLKRPEPGLREDVYEVEFEHLVFKDGSLVEDFSELHGLRLRTPYQTQKLLERSGFEVRAMSRASRAAKGFEPLEATEPRVMCVASRA